MSPEHRTVVHNNFVKGICNLLVGISTDRQKFEIAESVLEGDKAASVPVGNEFVYYDIQFTHTYGNKRIHYYCECKTRKEYSSQVTSDLKRHFKEFVRRAYKTIDWAESRYPDKYGFLFISDVPFEIWDNTIVFSYLKEVLQGVTSLNENKVSGLTSKVRILVLPDWFISLFQEETT